MGVAEYKRDRSKDSKLRVNDSPPIGVNVRASILEMRRVYSDKTDPEFAQWYSRRYKITEATILKVLEAAKQ